MKNTTLLICITALIQTSAIAQTLPKTKEEKADSVKSVYLDDIATRYPILRQGAISTEVLATGNSNSELYGNPLYKGKIQIVRERANFNVPISKWVKNSLLGSVNYLEQHFEINHVQDFNPQVPIYNQSFNKRTVGVSLTYSRNDSLFNTPVIYSGTIAGYTDQFSSVQRLNYAGTITFPLKHTATTSYSLGLVVIIDPSTPSPVLPIFSYWHKFQTDDLELYIDLPTRALIRKQLSARAWATFGTELSGSFAFFKLDQPQVPHDDTYSTLELKTGPSFEYKISQKVIIGVNGGLFSTLTARMFERNTNPNDYFIRNRNNSVPYANITLSFLPFLRTSKI
ncbi:hypothetical protein [Pedobacter sp. L105]|uniref:hypothetical protein n=1 Tax=Pedobacter sp. L105 TaxID=1641871 RepID=UPI00131E2389|nr:hypothetical protein [Pedobacter sp. L105]